MKRKIFIGVSLVGLMLTASAQTTVWSDDFNDEDISDWTVIDSDGDTHNWGDQFEIIDDQQQVITGKGLISRSWLGEGLTPDNWAISPAINLSQAEGAVTLNWKVQAAAGEWNNENYTVYVATTNTIAAFTGSPVVFNEIYTGTDEGESVSRTLDLSMLAGEEIVYIAFRHHDTENQDFLYIDDVVLTAETLTVNKYLDSKFSVYPNPASGIVNIISTENILTNSVSIYDVNGRIVRTMNFDRGFSPQIDISGLAAGVYILNIISNEGTASKKVVRTN